MPWGGTTGESRVYVRGGPTFDPDRWFAEVKKGHTFVTAGPMLEFTVSGLLPGDELDVRRGQKLKVHARATVGWPGMQMGPLGGGRQWRGGPVGSALGELGSSRLQLAR